MFIQLIVAAMSIVSNDIRVEMLRSFMEEAKFRISIVQSRSPLASVRTLALEKKRPLVAVSCDSELCKIVPLRNLEIDSRYYIGETSLENYRRNEIWFFLDLEQAKSIELTRADIFYSPHGTAQIQINLKRFF